MKNMSTLDWVAFILILIGALNWGLVGLFNLDLVAMIFGTMSMLSRIIYSIIGIAAVYVAFMSMGKKE